MTRSQIREGFRRIGAVLGGVFAAATIAVSILVTRPASVGSSWWWSAELAAIAAPLGWWCGSRLARGMGWIVAGFVRPSLDDVPEHPVEAARAELLTRIAAEDGPAASMVTRAHWALAPYFTYLAWLLAWLAADRAGYGVVQLQWQGLALPPGRTLDDVLDLTSPYWLWGARAVAGIVTFVVAKAIFFIASMMVHDLLFRRLRSRSA